MQGGGSGICSIDIYSKKVVSLIFNIHINSCDIGILNASFQVSVYSYIIIHRPGKKLELHLQISLNI